MSSKMQSPVELGGALLAGSTSVSSVHDASDAVRVTGPENIQAISSNAAAVLTVGDASAALSLCSSVI